MNHPVEEANSRDGSQGPAECQATRTSDLRANPVSSVRRSSRDGRLSIRRVAKVQDLGVLRSAPALALAGAVLLWGTTFVVSDTALESMSPAVLSVARFALA